MPELPEVESVRRGLDAYVVGGRIDQTFVYNPRAVRRQPGGAAEFIARTQGRRVIATDRRGKFMWLVLDDDSAIAIHLGMSGQLRVEPPYTPETDPGRHTRAAFDMSLPDGARHLINFNDQRTFGWVWACELVESRGRMVPEPAANIASDLLEPNLDVVALAHRMVRSRAAVKSVLLNQNIVSGIGNIYADEMLWAAKVDGRVPASDLSIRRLAKLLREGQVVLRRALAAGGTSFDALYVHVNGESGYFERSLNVYGRAGEPCPRCGRAIVRLPFANRSSYLCPRCQR
ncbi:MAG: bifunctional DNA-formamidopyrimidine glycosylase/DNA-(apurinic or apyrimidinic site) lyase [Corynebacterium sp.]|uniref:bifunctional DNA-formamidopyrimidine glycosylase/DNA-(apurinic or apyrimidinic site) lyase n=1 Tax=Corynebacterium sp. TaxID=1720 RepID=UPI0026DCD061|nr:bifunctional DNA-formamidopyrimidine glycosylase/DNA-(apurinic or apyrimidinic site) lyase [Corynebacterium sp.]MDO5029315.1 bifunctional DNA-formamidopyrimidine glycosylase/DNA-(apurinic or apyrimidinic site) lyase [Corynebacterium sp.]